MAGKMIKIPSREGGTFDAYLSVPESTGKVPAIVFASSVFGLDADHKALADIYAREGAIVVVPDLFWRTVPGPLPRDDKRAIERSMPRAERIATGEADMADSLAYVRTLAQFDGRSIAMGFCYGGGYAVLGPKRLGFTAGVACHGSDMDLVAGELTGMTGQVVVIWGDQDHAAPPEIVAQYQALAARMSNLEVDILPGVRHGYMMRGNPKSFDEGAYQFTTGKMLALLRGLPLAA